MTPEKMVKTTCQACDQSCGIICHVKDGKIVKIEGELVTSAIPIPLLSQKEKGMVKVRGGVFDENNGC